ncbi:uncharacterized protein [Musca autumnalis]|uniref:uncharacterized protein n=1 Tax=Musca autumnalis TaxID=221902 RepID=UPI003CEF9542
MENLSSMAASLPFYKEDIPMSDEERGVDADMVPLGSQDSDLGGVTRAATPIRESAPALSTTTTLPAEAASPLRENCTAALAPNPGSESQPAGDTPQVLLAATVNTEVPDTATPLREIAQASAGSHTSTWTIGSTSPLREIAPVVPGLPPTEVATQPQGKRTVARSVRQQGPKCVLCTQRHIIRACPNFLKMTCEERIRFVVQGHFCFNCLGRSHIRRDCLSRHRCQKCKGDHHTLLHPTKTPVPQRNVRPSGKKDNASISLRMSPTTKPTSSGQKSSKKRQSAPSGPVLSMSSTSVSPTIQSIQPIVTLGPTMVVKLLLPDSQVIVRPMCWT